MFLVTRSSLGSGISAQGIKAGSIIQITDVNSEKIDITGSQADVGIFIARAKVGKEGINLGGSQATGIIRLTDTSCDGPIFLRFASAGDIWIMSTTTSYQLTLSDMIVKGDLHISQVDMSDAIDGQGLRVGRNLTIDGTIKDLNLSRSVVSGTFALREVKWPMFSYVDLHEAHFGSIDADLTMSDKKSWPQTPPALAVQGLTFDQMSGKSIDAGRGGDDLAKSYARWIALGLQLIKLWRRRGGA